jgi:acetolactate synthase-1/2/3 large subunit
MLDLGNPNLDFVQLAQGMGVPAARVDTADGFVEQFGKAMREKGPRLIEVVVAM